MEKTDQTIRGAFQSTTCSPLYFQDGNHKPEMLVTRKILNRSTVSGILEESNGTMSLHQFQAAFTIRQLDGYVMQ